MRNMCRYNLGHRERHTHHDQKFTIQSGQYRSQSIAAAKQKHTSKRKT